MEETSHTESEDEIVSLLPSSKRRQRIESDISPVEPQAVTHDTFHVLATSGSSSAYPRQTTSSSTSSQESSDPVIEEIVGEDQGEKTRNQLIQRGIPGSDSSSESGEGKRAGRRAMASRKRREKQQASSSQVRQRFRHQVRSSDRRSTTRSQPLSEALLLNVPDVEMCSLEEEIAAVGMSSQHQVATTSNPPTQQQQVKPRKSFKPSPKRTRQPQQQRKGRNRPLAMSGARSTFSQKRGRLLDTETSVSSSSTSNSPTDPSCTSPPLKPVKKGAKRRKGDAVSARRGGERSNHGNKSGKNRASLRDSGSPLLSPEIGLQSTCNQLQHGSVNKLQSSVYDEGEGEEEGSSTPLRCQHIQNLASWESESSLGQKAAKGPVLFALEHLTERMNKKEDWMAKARFIWSQWKKLSREARSVYTETAKQNRLERFAEKRNSSPKVSSAPATSPTFSPLLFYNTTMMNTDTCPAQLMTTTQPHGTPTIPQIVSAPITVPAVTQRVTQIAARYFQEHPPGGSHFYQPPSDRMVLPTGSFFPSASLSLSSSPQTNMALQGSNLHYPFTVGDRATGMVGAYSDFHNQPPPPSPLAPSTLPSPSCSHPLPPRPPFPPDFPPPLPPSSLPPSHLPLASHPPSHLPIPSPDSSLKKDKSLRTLLSTKTLKGVYCSSAEPPQFLSGMSNHNPVSDEFLLQKVQSPMTTDTHLVNKSSSLSTSLPMRPPFQPATSFKRSTPSGSSASPSPTSSISPLLFQCPLTSPIMPHRSAPKPVYSIAGAPSEPLGMSAYLSSQHRPHLPVSSPTLIPSAAGSYSIATMQHRHSLSTIHHRPINTPSPTVFQGTSTSVAIPYSDTLENQSRSSAVTMLTNTHVTVSSSVQPLRLGASPGQYGVSTAHEATPMIPPTHSMSFSVAGHHGPMVCKSSHTAMIPPDQRLTASVMTHYHRGLTVPEVSSASSVTISDSSFLPPPSLPLFSPTSLSSASLSSPSSSNPPPSSLPLTSIPPILPSQSPTCTVPSVVGNSRKPSTGGLTEVSDEWRRLLLQRVRELGAKKHAGSGTSAKKRARSRGKQKQRPDSTTSTFRASGTDLRMPVNLPPNTPTSTPSLPLSPFTNSSSLSPFTNSSSFPNSQPLPSITTVSALQSRVSCPASTGLVMSNQTVTSTSQPQCLVAGEPSELRCLSETSTEKVSNREPVWVNYWEKDQEDGDGDGLDSLFGHLPMRVSGLSSTSSSSSSSPLPSMLSPSFGLPKNPSSPADTSLINYAGLERHYWQCLVKLDQLNQYTEAVHQRLKEAFHHQQIMLLHSDRYQEFLHKLVPPRWGAEEFNRLNCPENALPKLEFSGTFDRPVVKKVS